MPKASHASSEGEIASPAFEEAIQKLEIIVESMESGDLPLETLLQRFEEGTRLLRLCQDRLSEAELKIQRLEKDLSGELVARPLDAAGSGTDTETA